MRCTTPECYQVRALVSEWMGTHSRASMRWEVYEVQMGLDTVISIEDESLTRRFFLFGPLPNHELSLEDEQRIRDWLENLDEQPIVEGH